MGTTVIKKLHSTLRHVGHTITRYSHVCLLLTCAPDMASTVNRSGKHCVCVESTAYRYCPGRPLRNPCMTYMLCRYRTLWRCFDIMACPTGWPLYCLKWFQNTYISNGNGTRLYTVPPAIRNETACIAAHNKGKKLAPKCILHGFKTSIKMCVLFWTKICSQPPTYVSSAEVYREPV